MPEDTDLSAEAAAIQPRTPWHLWLVGILACLWNAVGVFDYLMTETRSGWYLASFTPEQVEFFLGFPAWLVAFWAIAVWGGLLGTILILLRKRLAVPVLLVSFVAMVVTTIHNFVLSNGLEIMEVAGAVFSGVIFVVALGLWLYARAMAAQGVLA